MGTNIDSLVKEIINFGLIKFSPNDPFLYSSGKKGPIYCDNRILSSNPQLWSKVLNALSQVIDSKNISYDFLTGVATAGIPHASALAMIRKEPMNYVRSKPKAHGTGKIVEGKVESSSKLLLVEDLVNQGSSIAKVIELVRNEGHIVEHVVCLMDYQTTASIEVAQKLGIEIISLINLTQLADIALIEKLIDERGHGQLMRWRKDPDNWL